MQLIPICIASVTLWKYINIKGPHLECPLAYGAIRPLKEGEALTILRDFTVHTFIYQLEIISNEWNHSVFKHIQKPFGMS